MKKKQLGRTGLIVSEIGLGGIPITRVEVPEGVDIIRHCFELGVNFFDTANVYGWKKGEGVTEQIVGRWLAQGGGRREKIVLATKVFGQMGEGLNDRHLSAYHIRRACEDSLRRLQTDHIDLYQMHHIDRDTPIEEIWQAMEQLVREGKVIYVGSSNFPAWHIAQANMAAEKRNFLGLVSEQCIYNLNCRWVELEVLPASKVFGLGVIPWSPLASGLLGGILRNIEEGRRASKRIQEQVKEKRPQLEEWENFCKELGEEPANVALAWLLANSVVTGPIIGPRTMDQLTGCQRSLEIILDEDTMKRLGEIWPGQGGQAPEAYSW